MEKRSSFTSKLGFVLAAAGSAVGLGNIWRYPYVLYSNGGRAFYIPYIVAILLMGIPFLILEYGVGYNFKSSFAKAAKKKKSGRPAGHSPKRKEKTHGDQEDHQPLQEKRLPHSV